MVNLIVLEFKAILFISSQYKYGIISLLGPHLLQIINMIINS